MTCPSQLCCCYDSTRSLVSLRNSLTRQATMLSTSKIPPILVYHLSWSQTSHCVVGGRGFVGHSHGYRRSGTASSLTSPRASTNTSSPLLSWRMETDSTLSLVQQKETAIVGPGKRLSFHLLLFGSPRLGQYEAAPAQTHHTSC